MGMMTAVQVDVWNGKRKVGERRKGFGGEAGNALGMTLKAATHSLDENSCSPGGVDLTAPHACATC